MTRYHWLGRLIMVISVALGMSARPALPASAQEPEHVDESFDRSPVELALHREARVADGTLVLPPGSFAAYETPTQDFTLQIGIHFEDGAQMVIGYRSRNPKANLLVLGPEWAVFQREDSGGVEEVATPTTPIPPPDSSGWRHVQLIADGDLHTVLIDGERVIQYTETDPVYPAGIMSLESIGAATLAIDYFMLGPPEDAPAAHAPSPDVPTGSSTHPEAWIVEEFDDGLPGGEWEYSDAWRVTDGVLRTTERDQFLYHPAEREDFMLEVRMRRQGDSRIGIFFRASEPGGYEVSFETMEINLFDTHGSGEEPTALDWVDWGLDDNWHDFVIWVEGTHAVVLMDGEQLFETHNLTDPPGGFGVFQGNRAATFEIDWIAFGPPVDLTDLLGDDSMPSASSSDDDLPPDVCRITSTQTVNIRRGPNLGHAVIDTLSPGEVLQAHGRSLSNWWSVALGPQTRGWVFADVVQATGPQCETLPVIADGTDSTEQPPAEQPPAEQPPANWTTDIGLGDIFLAGSPVGVVNVLITNHGPGTMNNVNVPVSCDATGTNTSGGTDHQQSPQQNFTMSAAPGDSMTFSTGWSLDTSQYTYTVTCRSAPGYDSTPGNNTATKTFQQMAEAHIIRADLVPTDIFPDSLPTGDIYVRITNNGPDRLDGATVGLNCTAIVHTYVAGDPTTTAGSSSAVTVTLAPGQTEAYHTGIGITDSTQWWYDVTCTVNLPLLDPNDGNNSYQETIPPPP